MYLTSHHFGFMLLRMYIHFFKNASLFTIIYFYHHYPNWLLASHCELSWRVNIFFLLRSGKDTDAKDACRKKGEKMSDEYFHAVVWKIGLFLVSRQLCFPRFPSLWKPIMLGTHAFIMYFWATSENTGDSNRCSSIFIFSFISYCRRNAAYKLHENFCCVKNACETVT